MHSLSFYRILQFSFLAISSFFLLSLSVLPQPVFVILKITPALIATILALLYADSEKKCLLILTFLFMANGDLLLGLSRSKFFTFALASFMIGNTLLLIYMIPHAKKSLTGTLRVFGIVVFNMMIGYLILPNTDYFFLPVLIYMIVICSMTLVSALNAANRHWLIFAGAVSFNFSDSLIAFDKFVHPVHGSLTIILTLYYIAVYCLCFGFISAPPVLKQSIKS